MRYLYGIIIALFVFFGFVAMWTKVVGYTSNLTDIPSAYANLGALLIIPLAIIIIWYVTWFVVKHGRLGRRQGIRRVYRSQALKKSLSETSPVILYFQPNVTVAKKFAQKLTQAGYDVIHFQSPSAEPGQLIKLEKPALIITDIMMPGLDGLELARQVTARPETKNLPVVGVSDIGSETVKQKALAVGMKEFFSLHHYSADEIVLKISAYLIPTLI